MAVDAFDLSGRRALVTGAGRGLGRAMALGLAEAGAEVVLTARTGAELEVVREAIVAAGGSAVAHVADLADPRAIETLAEEAAAAGPIDVLVLNAGRADMAPFLEADDDLWERIFALNFFSAIRLTSAVGAGMCERRRGSVVFVGSVLGRTAVRGGLVPYAATKGALEQVTRALAVEWARRGVRVNAIAPAYVETDMNQQALAEERTRAHLLGRTPMKRFGRPEEIVPALLYLASDASSYTTGTIVHVDGGWTAG